MSDKPPGLDELLSTSLKLITSLQADDGAYPASPTFSAYEGYCWFRDGAFIADGVSAAGEEASAGAFFDWCARTILGRAATIDAVVAAAERGDRLSEDQMLPARFAMRDGLHDVDWWNFQLDGYGTWLWAVTEHAARYGLEVDRWRDAAALTVDYLTSTWSLPCYDWWEEHNEQVHVSTLGCIAAGLGAAVEHGLVDGTRADRAAATVASIRVLLEDRGVVEGHLAKWLGSPEVDGSLSALIAPLGLIDPRSELSGATLDAIEREIAAEGGVYRFPADTFFGGGRWPLLTCFYGLGRAAQGETDRAWDALRWAAACATDEGFLPEQVDGLLLHPEFRQEWVDRWGPVATPLLWSHAMLLRLAAALGIIDHHQETT